MTNSFASYTELNLELRCPKLGIQVETIIPLSQGIVGVFGPSGHGKSTILRMVAGVQSATVSNCVLLNTNVSVECRIESQSNIESIPILYQDQTATLFTAMTVIKNLEFVQRHSLWSKQCKFSLSQVIGWCQLFELLNKSVAVLSGGEQQRVALARSLLSGKPILFLDEPFSALDWATRMYFMELIKHLVEDYGLRVILVSHSLKELAMCSHYLLHIEQGKVVQSGPTKTMIDELSRRQTSGIFARIPLKLVERLNSMDLNKWHVTGDSSSVVYSSTHQHYEKKHTVVTLDADKVSIAKSTPSATSMLNNLTGCVADIQASNQMLLITINVGEQVIYSLISKLSFEQLKLQIGDRVQALFKAI